MATLMVSAMLAGLAAAVVVSAPAAHAAFPGTNGLIVWSVNNPPDLSIKSLDPATGIVTTLCTGACDTGAHPVVSPNGQTIAFACSTGLCTMPITGGSTTSLSGTAAGDVEPSFTPDGTTLVFRNGGSASGSLFRVSATGAGGRTAIFGSPPDTVHPEASPDGTTIAFERAGPPGPLFTMPLAGGVATQRSVGTGGTVQPGTLSWSPDGTKIAVWAPGPCGTTPIGIVPASGNNATPSCLPSSTSGPGGTLGDINPVWSPDGTKIAVVSSSGFPGANNITILNASGTPGRTPFTSVTSAFAFGPYWAVASSTTTTTASGPTTTTTTPCSGTLSGTAFKGSHAKPKKALAGVVVSAAPTPTGTTLTGTTNAAGQYSFTVPCGTYNKTATGPANNSRTCHFGSGKGPITAVATVTNGSTDVENLFCKGR